MKRTREFTVAYLNTASFSAVQMLFYTSIPSLTEQTGVSAATVIGSISVGSLIFAITGPYWAAKSDELGRRPILGLGSFGLFLSFSLISLVFLFSNELPLWAKTSLIVASRLIYGTLASAVIPVSQAWQVDLSDKQERLKILTRNSMCLNFGRLFGPSVILLQFAQIQTLIYGATTWLLLLALFCLLTPTVKKKIQESIAFIQACRQQVIKWRLSFQESFSPLMLALFFTSFIGILHTSLGQHMKNVFQIRGDEATLLMAKIVLVLSLSALVFQQLGIWLFKKHWVPRLIIGSLAMIVGALLLLKASNPSELWPAIVLIALGIGYIPPVYLTLTSMKGEERHGRKVGAAGVAHSLGYTVGTGLVALSIKLQLMEVTGVILLVSFVLGAITLDLLLRGRKEASYAVTA